MKLGAWKYRQVVPTSKLQCTYFPKSDNKVELIMLLSQHYYSVIVLGTTTLTDGLMYLIICNLPKYSFLMVKQCSYCVLKVPNDDGPSMSIIENFS